MITTRERHVATAAAERVRIPLRRVRGCWAVVLLERIGERWAIAVGTGGPGHGSESTLVDLSDTFPAPWNAIDAGAMKIRNWWQSRDVPAVVADVQEFLDRWE